jgi:hypothetical protein
MERTEELKWYQGDEQFEHWPPGAEYDEADVSARAYVASIPEDKLSQYDPKWTDEQVMEWDGNFRMDGGLMLVCVERDIEIDEFRQIIADYLEFRKAHPKPATA